jgi:hypothetical protein
LQLIVKDVEVWSSSHTRDEPHLQKIITTFLSGPAHQSPTPHKSGKMAPSAIRLTEASARGIIQASRRTPISSTTLRALAALSQHRNYNSTPSTFAPSSSSSPSILGLGFNPSGSGAAPSYFQRPSLPANTIIRFVPQQTAWIVERMGKFNRILQPGLAVLIPFIDRIAYVKSLKEAAIEIPSQSAITADNVTLELDGVLYTRVFDAYKASYVSLTHHLSRHHTLNIYVLIGSK